MIWDFFTKIPNNIVYIDIYMYILLYIRLHEDANNQVDSTVGLRSEYTITFHRVGKVLNLLEILSGWEIK